MPLYSSSSFQAFQPDPKLEHVCSITNYHPLSRPPFNVASASGQEGAQVSFGAEVDHHGYDTGAIKWRFSHERDRRVCVCRMVDLVMARYYNGTQVVVAL